MKTYRFQLVKSQKLPCRNNYYSVYKTSFKQNCMVSNDFDWGHLLIVSIISSVNVPVQLWRLLKILTYPVY